MASAITAATPRDAWRFPALDLRTHARAYALIAAINAALALLFVLDRASGTAAAREGFPLDDAWIHLVYARSLATGHGFAYNTGVQESGFSSPLWAIVIAPMFWLKPLWGGSIVAGVKTLGTLVSAWGGVCAYRLMLRLTGRASAAWAAVLLITLDPWLCFARVSGMEVWLSATAVLFVLWSASEGAWLGVSLGLCLATLARPENLLLWAVAGACAAWAFAREPGLRRSIALAALPSVVSVGAWAAFCLATTGRPLPNTYYAKHLPGGLGLYVFNLDQLVSRALVRLPMMYLSSGFWLYAFGAALLLRGARDRRFDENALRAVVALYPPFATLALARSHGFLQPESFYWNRYFEPVTVLWALPIAVALGAADPREHWRASPRRALFVLAGAVFWVLPWVRVPFALRNAADLFAKNCQNIQEMNVALGRWVGTHVPPWRAVAVSDAGAVRYFGGRNTVDLSGLNDHRVLGGARAAVLRATDPMYYVIFPSNRDAAINPDALRPVIAARAREYTICDCPTQHVMVAYEVGSSK